LKDDSDPNEETVHVSFVVVVVVVAVAVAASLD
jgi:hypothetical protein